jgi:hypothetical protein
MRILRLLRFALFATALTTLLVPTLIGAVPMWVLIHPPCDYNPTTPADFGLDYTEITIPAPSIREGATMRGYFIPGAAEKNGATVLHVPTMSNTRGQLWEIQLIAKAGFNAVTFDSIVCSGRAVHSLGYAEVEQVGDVLNYLNTEGASLGIDPDKIALHGFSSAGATSLMATGRYPQIRAVLAEGGYHSFEGHIGMSAANNALEALMLFGARAAYRIGTGYDVSVLSPIESVKHIPPRPMYLVYGSRETSLGGAQAQLQAAKDVDPAAPAWLWIVPNAIHGGYTTAVGEQEYTRRVVPFYECTLLDDCAAWEMLWG